MFKVVETLKKDILLQKSIVFVPRPCMYAFQQSKYNHSDLLESVMQAYYCSFVVVLLFK